MWRIANGGFLTNDDLERDRIGYHQQVIITESRRCETKQSQPRDGGPQQPRGDSERSENVRLGRLHPLVERQNRTTIRANSQDFTSLLSLLVLVRNPITCRGVFLLTTSSSSDADDKASAEPKFCRRAVRESTFSLILLPPRN